jgi:hypothetical protein
MPSKSQVPIATISPFTTKKQEEYREANPSVTPGETINANTLNIALMSTPNFKLKGILLLNTTVFIC